jgi:transposase
LGFQALSKATSKPCGPAFKDHTLPEMLLRGILSFSRRPYLTKHFFENKPTQLLLGADITPEDLTDYTLGHTLDEVSDFGASELFARVAFDIAMEHDLLASTAHLDSTSLSVSGDYKSDSSDGELVQKPNRYEPNI